MTAYYNKTKDMICIRELYSESCDADNDVNLFFTSIRTILQDLSNNNEIELITFMCDRQIIFPVEFLHEYESNRDNLISDIVNLEFDKTIVENLVLQLVDVANKIMKPQKLIDSDPRTNNST